MITCDAQRSPECAYLNQTLNALLSIGLHFSCKCIQNSITDLLILPCIDCFPIVLANPFVHKQFKYNEYF